MRLSCLALCLTLTLACVPTPLTGPFLSSPAPTKDAELVWVDLHSVVDGRTDNGDLQQSGVINLGTKELKKDNNYRQLIDPTKDYLPFFGSASVSGESVSVLAAGKNLTFPLFGATYVVAFAVQSLNRVYVIAKRPNIEGLFVFIETLDGNPKLTRVIRVNLEDKQTGRDLDVVIGTDPSAVFISAEQGVAALPASSTAYPCMTHLWFHFMDAVPGDASTATFSYLGYNGYAQYNKWVEQYIDLEGHFRGISVRDLTTLNTVDLVYTDAELIAFVTEWGMPLDRCVADLPCKNGASCAYRENAPGYSCTCLPGFVGATCDTPVASEPSPKPAANETGDEASSPAPLPPKGGGSLNSTVGIGATVAKKNTEFNWSSFAATVAEAMGVHPESIVELSQTMVQNFDHTIVQFTVTDVDNAGMLKNHKTLQQWVYSGNATSGKVPILAVQIHGRRELLENMEVDDSGIPAWMVVGIILMSLLFLICLKLEW